MFDMSSSFDRDHMFFRLCSDHLSIEAIPRSPVQIEFARLKDRSLGGYELLMWTPHFIVLRGQGREEITVRRDGRMVVRKAPSEEAAREIAESIMRLALGEFLE